MIPLKELPAHLKSLEACNANGEIIYTFASPGHIAVTLPREIVGNLYKLMNYLLSGNLKASFHMACWADEDHLTDDVHKNITECGTVGCAVGHGPFAGIAKYPSESWHGYAKRCFIKSDGFEKTLIFDFLFQINWACFDNSALGAGRRIQYMLSYGIPRGLDSEQPDYNKIISLYR